MSGGNVLCNPLIAIRNYFSHPDNYLHVLLDNSGKGASNG